MESSPRLFVLLSQSQSDFHRSRHALRQHLWDLLAPPSLGVMPGTQHGSWSWHWSSKSNSWILRRQLEIYLREISVTSQSQGPYLQLPSPKQIQAEKMMLQSLAGTKAKAIFQINTQKHNSGSKTSNQQKHPLKGIQNADPSAAWKST